MQRAFVRWIGALTESRIAALALAALLSAGVLIGTASAIPLNGLKAITKQNAQGVEKIRWVCGPYRCWWRPGPFWGAPYWGYPYRYWGPGYYCNPYYSPYCYYGYRW